MSKTVKGFLLGVICTLLLVNGVIFAAGTMTLKDVKVGGVTLVVDGQKVNPKNANGDAVEPLIYKGTTYLPVRAVADALKKPVYWDGPNYTVYVGNADAKLEYPTEYLADLKSLDDDIRKSDKISDNYGNTYDSAIYGYYKKYRFLTDMKYQALKGVLYVSEGETSDSIVYMQVIADGKKIYTSPMIDKTSRPVDVNVNITGYNDIQVQFKEKKYGGGDFGINFGNAGFYQ